MLHVIHLKILVTFSGHLSEKSLLSYFHDMNLIPFLMFGYKHLFLKILGLCELLCTEQVLNFRQTQKWLFFGDNLHGRNNTFLKFDTKITYLMLMLNF